MPFDGLALYLTQGLQYPENGCWIWPWGKDKDGYAINTHAYEIIGTSRVHRALYMLLVGDISVGLELDHECKNRACVNPAHMRPVTSKQNKENANNFERNKTHCIRGHEFTEENTYVFPSDSSHAGERLCKECNRIRARRARSAKIRRRY